MNSKILKIIVAILSLIGIGLFLRVASINEEDAVAISNAVSPLVTYSLVLLGLTIIAALIVSLLGIIKNPAALKKTLLGIVALVIILIISYILASDAQVMDANKEILAASGSQVSKYTSTGIWVSLILLVVGGAFFMFDLVKGLIKS